ncbi:energy-coupling factor ABC transporter substrate-binding protein [Propioniciclava sp. MC1683]|uniref:energy-coupling factor ABC transporter substrate-binding protein n=1 Tax=Propioniciclava sp. MC1683 TaxID=2760309 RepID=UPI0016047405|nr:energy-coupling factor ABC transporter substrate-binding protein [Propioniciclava sp. MC1683]MBB1502604.1 energy-coupling factor ABC transporter substrate-binding protein [Propioniciclava sp. MC1683]
MRDQNRWITPVLVALLVILFAMPFALAPRPTSPDEEAFGGTDAVVTTMLEQDGTKPWFDPIFEPGSGEIESGLFGLQAALGAGVLGYVLGNLRGRKVGRETVTSEHHRT